MNNQFSRRTFLKMLGASSLALYFPRSLQAIEAKPLKKIIPASGETLSAIGMGTSRTFDVSTDSDMMSQLHGVLQAFFDNGGQLIDSSPMYGNAETVTGELLTKVNNKEDLFAATKVWADGRENGINQMNESMLKMNVPVMDLMQIHNLRDWKVHLATLREWKEQGKIRYIGITTSHGRDHEELIQIMKTESLDFVQFSYSLANRTVEKNLLPVAADKGIATLINRPFERGDMFKTVKGEALPGWAGEIDCDSWGKIFLKYVISHPAVTCAIPATSRVKHMVDNMGAAFGIMPDSTMRKIMEDYFNSL